LVPAPVATPAVAAAVAILLLLCTSVENKENNPLEWDSNSAKANKEKMGNFSLTN
jgi:hypothetical protein